MIRAVTAQKHRFTTLDGLRGGAAAMVVITHTSNLAPMTYLVVYFFFMLSGFVLAYSAGPQLQILGTAGRVVKRHFLASRLIRVYPLYLTGTLMAVPLAVGFVLVGYDNWNWTEFFAAVAAAPFFIPLPYDWSFPLDLPGWTLTYELGMNAVFLFTGWRWLPSLVIVAICAPLYWWDSGNSYWGTIAGEIPVAMLCYFFGVLACRLWCEAKFLRIGLHPLLLMAILCGVYFYPARNGDLYATVVIFAVHPVILWLGACTVAKDWVARLMDWLGRVSYGVYILHIPIFMWFESALWLLGKFHPHLAGRIDGRAPFIVLPAAFWAAHVLTKRLDAPVRKWLWGKYAQVFAAA